MSANSTASIDLEAALKYIQEINVETCANWLGYFSEAAGDDPFDLLTLIRKVEAAVKLNGEERSEAIADIRARVDDIPLHALRAIGLEGTARALFKAVGLRP